MVFPKAPGEIAHAREAGFDGLDKRITGAPTIDPDMLSETKLVFARAEQLKLVSTGHLTPARWLHVEIFPDKMRDNLFGF